MNRRDIVLFDLDGTITDPGVGICNSVSHALARMNRPPLSRETLLQFIGPPLVDSFMEHCGMSREEAGTAIDYYREYYKPKGMLECYVYPGIEALFTALRQAGKILALATSKPQPFARQLLEHYHLDGYFAHIAGASMDNSLVEKADVIRNALIALEITDPSRAVIVGDRKYDILGAKETGIASLGVLYGYGSREELTAAGADALAEIPEEVGAILTTGWR